MVAKRPRRWRGAPRLSTNVADDMMLAPTADPLEAIVDGSHDNSLKQRPNIHFKVL
jgi:hypothetical protein